MQHDSLDEFIQNGGPNRTAIVPGYHPNMKIEITVTACVFALPEAVGMEPVRICLFSCPDSETNTTNLLYVIVLVLLV